MQEPQGPYLHRDTLNRRGLLPYPRRHSHRFPHQSIHRHPPRSHRPALPLPLPTLTPPSRQQEFRILAIRILQIPFCNLRSNSNNGSHGCGCDNLRRGGSAGARASRLRRCAKELLRESVVRLPRPTRECELHECR